MATDGIAKQSTLNDLIRFEIDQSPGIDLKFQNRSL